MPLGEQGNSAVVEEKGVRREGSFRAPACSELKRVTNLQIFARLHLNVQSSEADEAATGDRARNVSEGIPCPRVLPLSSLKASLLGSP